MPDDPVAEAWTAAYRAIHDAVATALESNSWFDCDEAFDTAVNEVGRYAQARALRVLDEALDALTRPHCSRRLDEIRAAIERGEL